ncbi:hypothetical protein LTS10_011754 [Elasticomyces elasticus]|nr:hypothetical protein LTS10_011754 [Elasticomyces elasticus]
MDAVSVTTPYQVNFNITANVTYNPGPAEQSTQDDYFQERDLSSIFRRSVLYEGSANLLASIYCATPMRSLTWTAERLITSTRPAARAAYRSEAINCGRAAIVSRILMASVTPGLAGVRWRKDIAAPTAWGLRFILSTTRRLSGF